MRASELRIGNYVTIDNPTAWPEMKGIPMQVTATKLCVDEYFPESTGSVRLEYGGDKSAHSQFDEFIQPIPLTSEWLEKCENDYYGFYKQSDGSYSLIDDYGDGSTYYIGNLRYVHQLQNLFFALTGNELTMKE